MAETFRFSLGTFSCLAIQDDVVSYPIAMFFTNVAKNLYEPLLRENAQGTAEIEVPYTCLFIDTGRRRVLVDTGIGGYASGPTPAMLLPLLRAEGIEL